MMNRIKKAQKLVEDGRIEILHQDEDSIQFIVWSGKNKSYLVNSTYSVWKCQEICGDWHHRGKDGTVDGSFLCYHILGCIYFLFNERSKGQVTLEAAPKVNV